MRKIIGPFLSLVLVAGLGFAIYQSLSEEMSQRSAVTLKGIGGSEKAVFFHDPRVIDVLNQQNIQIDYQKSGSRQIATQTDLNAYDFAFPAGSPAAEKIYQDFHTTKGTPIFYTPMVLASWKPVVEILIANDIAELRNDIYFVDMKKLLVLMQSSTHWKALQQSQQYPVNKAISITTTDIRKSNSAAMYLALMSFIVNQNTVVQNTAMASAITDTMQKLFLQQGFTEYSSAEPFNDYLIMGAGKTPLLFTYESQFIHAAKEGKIRADMVLMYPEPTVFAKHTLVPLNERGSELVTALSNNPELQKLAIEHGYRNQDIQAFNQQAQQLKLKLPENLYNVIDTPSYELLESMIQSIASQY